MEGRGNLIAAIIVIILVLAVVFGTILYLTKSFGGRINLFGSLPKVTSLPIKTSNPIATSSPSSTKQVTSNPIISTPVPTIVSVGGGKSIYYAKGFQIQYPANWGVLSCTTSSNFEFDPYNSANQKLSCDRAVKPITVLIDQGLACRGDLKKIGSHQVYVSKVAYRDWLTNEYCLNESGRNIDITNRVATTGAIGTGKDDFSSQVEQMISTISFQ